jgi:hypothetical protein
MYKHMGNTKLTVPNEFGLIRTRVFFFGYKVMAGLTLTNIFWEGTTLTCKEREFDVRKKTLMKTILKKVQCCCWCSTAIRGMLRII